ncbi:MAG: hypothetical protein AAF985_00980 [Bacteroidota bacterium]
MNKWILFLVYFGMFAPAAEATDIIFKSRAATTLNSVTLYTDSTFSKPSNTFFKGGHLFEVLGESIEEHTDDSENQKFKWFRVRSEDGQSGWIYGDGLAVIVPDDKVKTVLQPFHKKKYHFDNGFDQATLWVATIEGRDNFHEQDYLNPGYEEVYIVITNDRGRSVHINVGGNNARGAYELHHAELFDATGDRIPEILVQTSSLPVGSNVENRNLEVYSFQAGTLSKVFEERMTLNYGDDLPSPSLFKHIEIAPQSIRIAYVDYPICSDAKVNIGKKLKGKKTERCMEYVTYTYLWNERKSRYETLYEANHSFVKGGIRYSGIYLQEKASIASKRIKLIDRSNQLYILKHYEKFIRKGKSTQVVPYLYVRLQSGEEGYVLADKVGFIDLEHAELLTDYYSKPPINRADWKSNTNFLSITNQVDPSASRDR